MATPDQQNQLLQCFSFYNNLEDLNMSDLQFKNDFKFTIVHPYKQWNQPKPIEEIPQIEVTFTMCILYKGKPSGLAAFKYTDPQSKLNPFEGVGVITDGKLHNGPFIFI